jgi:transcriptional regulator with PAS, ATPase and Fis domain
LIAEEAAMSHLRSVGTDRNERQERADAPAGTPFSLEEVSVPANGTLRQPRPPNEDLRSPQEPREPYRLENIVGSSERMVEVYRLVARVAPTRSTVLIQGETGTGKELIARAIHHSTLRADRPFVAIDCSALAETLLESELFGHVKGAFTGALADKKGLFEAAHGGTCFLDEVGEISPGMQAKLLRVVQEHEVKRVGGTESLQVDVRVIAATNKDLGRLVAEGRFREDLFYRLSVVTIGLPPLRERREDIPLLAEHFLRKCAAENDRPISHISPEAMALLAAYDWPGNVRELEHAVEHAVALTSNRVILPDDLPPKCAPPRQEAAPGRPSLSLREVVTRHIRNVLREANWNKKLAAELLGIHRRTLYRLSKRYGIPLEERSETDRLTQPDQGHSGPKFPRRLGFLERRRRGL